MNRDTQICMCLWWAFVSCLIFWHLSFNVDWESEKAKIRKSVSYSQSKLTEGMEWVSVWHNLVTAYPEVNEEAGQVCPYSLSEKELSATSKEKVREHAHQMAPEPRLCLPLCLGFDAEVNREASVCFITNVSLLKSQYCMTSWIDLTPPSWIWMSPCVAIFSVVICLWRV